MNLDGELPKSEMLSLKTAIENDNADAFASIWLKNNLGPHHQTYHTCGNTRRIRGKTSVGYRDDGYLKGYGLGTNYREKEQLTLSDATDNAMLSGVMTDVTLGQARSVENNTDFVEVVKSSDGNADMEENIENEEFSRIKV